MGLHEFLVPLVVLWHWNSVLLICNCYTNLQYLLVYHISRYERQRSKWCYLRHDHGDRILVWNSLAILGLWRYVGHSNHSWNDLLLQPLFCSVLRLVEVYVHLQLLEDIVRIQPNTRHPVLVLQPSPPRTHRHEFLPRHQLLLRLAWSKQGLRQVSLDWQRWNSSGSEEQQSCISHCQWQWFGAGVSTIHAGW